MAPSLKLSSLVLLAMSWMLAAGCSDSDSIMIASGGSAGHSGSAGASANAGSAGKTGGGGAHPGAAGEAGEAGSSGSGAASGSSDAGSAGAAGEAGAPVSAGGGSGGTGGTSGGGTSGGGTGGTSGGGTGGGTGGTGGAAPVVVKNCAYQCATDDDCKITGEDPQTHFCNPTRKRCEDSSVCATKADCVAFASQFIWFTPCTGDADCAPGTEACVAAGGTGLCASLPDAQTGCADGVATQVARFGATGNVQVCASTDGICVDKACQFNCGSAFGGCSDGTLCNAVTGQCDCSASTQCKAKGKPVCGATSQCECATSDQCSAITVAGFDQCYAGKCGCSNAAACAASPYKNATAVCE